MDAKSTPQGVIIASEFTRFRVKHPRWEPYAGIPHVRFCAGGAQ